MLFFIDSGHRKGAFSGHWHRLLPCGVSGKRSDSSHEVFDAGIGFALHDFSVGSGQPLVNRQSTVSQPSVNLHDAWQWDSGFALG
jgi:hypothetical protein